MQDLNVARELLLGTRTASKRIDPADGPPPRGGRSLRRRDPNEERIKRSVHQMPYGMYIIGTARDGEPNGMIADWVMQVSFDPRLVAVAFENNAYSLGSVRNNKSFTVNLLPEAGMELAARFLQPRDGGKIAGRSPEAAAQIHEKMLDVPYRGATNRCPILADALSWLECEAEQFVPAGDHTLVIGRVLDGGVEQTAEPLTSLYTGWVYSG